jgi:hypothetical protein
MNQQHKKTPQGKALASPRTATDSYEQELDAARWRYVVKNAQWYRDSEQGTLMVVALPQNTDLSSIGTRTDAIDRAMKAKSLSAR